MMGTFRDDGRARAIAEDAPGVRWADVTPADGAAAQWDDPPRALWVGGAGNVALRGADGVECTFSGVQAGTLLALRPRRVLATGTTATLIRAIW